MHPQPVWLSILLPVYNVQEYLRDCFASIFSQWVDGIEVIALDDLSADGSYEILQDLSTEYGGRIKILRHRVNQGLSGARNSLIDAAVGDYLWFLDSDDALADGAIAQLQSIVKHHAPDLVLCDYQIWRPDENQISSKQKKRWRKEQHVTTFSGQSGVLLNDPLALFEGLFSKGKLHSWSKISKRVLWQHDLRFPEGKYFEDMVTTPRLALRVHNYYYANCVWVRYRQRAGSILAVPSVQKIDDMATGVSGVLSVWQAKYPAMPSRVRFAFIRYCVKVYFFTRKQVCKIDNNNSQLLTHYKQLVYQDIELTKIGLIAQYLQHGEFFRVLKVIRLL